MSSDISNFVFFFQNMNYFELSFKNSDKDSGRNVINALLHHVYPKRHTLLFAYDYRYVPIFVTDISI